MKVMALIESLDHVCYRYRIEAFAWALAERGLHLESVPLRRGIWARIGQLRAAGRSAQQSHVLPRGGADAVILQRRLLPIWQLALLRRYARRLIYDLDDALFQRDSYSRKGPQSSVRMARFWATVYAADAVIVGNDYLRRFTSAFIEPGRVHLIPTCVEPRWYRLARHQRVGSAARLVWIGQRSTLASLRRAGEHLAAAGRRCGGCPDPIPLGGDGGDVRTGYPPTAPVPGRLPGLQLRVICDGSVRLPGVNVVPRPWSSATEAAELSDGDIGINWLPDDGWSRGKCGLKLLQYMAAGLPVVANPVGMNRQMVVHGQTGLLASTPQEWAEAIARLAADPPLRRQMGAAGRRLVEQRYSVADWGPRLADVVQMVTCSAQTGSADDGAADLRLPTEPTLAGSVPMPAPSGPAVSGGCQG